LNPNVNVFLNYLGVTSGCSNTNETLCNASEQIGFSVGYWQYSNGCGPHHYTWKVDGAQVGSDADNTTVTLTSGNHTVSVTIDNGNTPTTTMSQTLNVGNGAQPDYTGKIKAVELVLPPNSYAFTLTTDPEVVASQGQWVWNFGDGSGDVTGGSIQTHTYSDSRTTYSVSVHSTTSSPPLATETITEALAANAPARRRGVRH
jgi:hypothetical protein